MTILLSFQVRKLRLDAVKGEREGRILRLITVTLTRGWWYEDALGERVSSVALFTSAGWYVVNNLTSGLEPTGSRTGVQAF